MARAQFLPLSRYLTMIPSNSSMELFDSRNLAQIPRAPGYQWVKCTKPVAAGVMLFETLEEKQRWQQDQLADEPVRFPGLNRGLLGRWYQARFPA